MESAILAKLRLKLAAPPRDEADIVYMLVEIRKYLDHTNPQWTTYPVLRTYCDWSAHIRLSQSGAEILLRSLDDAFMAPEAEQGRALKTAFDTFSLTEFQRELRLFLKSVDLPCRLIEDHVWWGQFLRHYVAVVSDCPFIYGGKPKHPRAIKKATLTINEATKSLETAVEGTVNIVWVWKLEFTDRSKREISNTCRKCSRLVESVLSSVRCHSKINFFGLSPKTEFAKSKEYWDPLPQGDCLSYAPSEGLAHFRKPNRVHSSVTF
jgi:hypothetical protein